MRIAQLSLSASYNTFQRCVCMSLYKFNMLIRHFFAKSLHHRQELTPKGICRLLSIVCENLKELSIFLIVICLEDFQSVFDPTIFNIYTIYIQCIVLLMDGTNSASLSSTLSYSRRSFNCYEDLVLGIPNFSTIERFYLLEEEMLMKSMTE